MAAFPRGHRSASGIFVTASLKFELFERWIVSFLEKEKKEE